MQRMIFSVFDSKAGAFLAPFVCMNVAVAQRWFHQMVNDREHDFGRYPEDYTLFYLGLFDETTAKFDVAATPESVVLGLAIQKMVEV